MFNLFELIRDELSCQKLKIDDLVCSEYACPLEEEGFYLFSQSDCVIHVLSGRKSWKTMHGSYDLRAGQTLYLKKGATFIRQFFDDDFCMLVFFIPDGFLKAVVSEFKSSNSFFSKVEFTQEGKILTNDEHLNGYFQAMLPYFRTAEPPSSDILNLKIKELILLILGNPVNHDLAAYWQQLSSDSSSFLRSIVEANFCYDLTLEELAKIAHRSLSTFKRDFKEIYGVPPGKWIQRRRVEYAVQMMQNPYLTVSEVATRCGFKDLSHFSSSFKSRVGHSPTEFRQQLISDMSPV